MSSALSTTWWAHLLPAIRLEVLAVTTYGSTPSSPLVREKVGIERSHLWWHRGPFDQRLRIDRVSTGILLEYCQR